MTAATATTSLRPELSSQERVAALRAAGSDHEAFAVMALACAAPEWSERRSVYRDELIARRADDDARRTLLDDALAVIERACPGSWAAVESMLRRRADYLAEKPKREVSRRTSLPTRQPGATAFSDWRESLSSHGPGRNPAAR